MAESPLDELHRRERQIMEVVYAEGRVSVRDVLERLPDPPSYSSVRTMLRILEEKGHVVHEQDGPRYLYRPAVPPKTVRKAALRDVVQTFFDGSVEKAAAALFEVGGAELSEEQAERIREMIDEARRGGR